MIMGVSIKPFQSTTMRMQCSLQQKRGLEKSKIEGPITCFSLACSTSTLQGGEGGIGNTMADTNISEEEARVVTHSLQQ